MKHVLCSVTLAAIWISAATSAYGQPSSERSADPLLQQQRRLDLETPPTTPNILQRQLARDRELRAIRESEAPLESFLDWQWGGWVEYYWFSIDDGVQSSRILHQPGLSVWTRMRWDQDNHEIFARMRLDYQYFHDGDEYDRQEDWIGPNLNRGWYRVNLLRALRLIEQDSPFGFSVKIGRQEVRWGSGFVLDLPLDALTFVGTLPNWRIRGLFSNNAGNLPNIDTGEPVDSHMSRRFFGVEAAYTGFDLHEPYAYALWNDDYTDERPQNYFQNYAYDTQYYGIGARGPRQPRRNYLGELVFVKGDRVGEGQWFKHDHVQAWAVDLGLEYRFDHASRPRLAFEYLFGSGDNDRIFSGTSAEGGNRRGRDTTFAGFGYRDTGIALAPRVSNLHIWKLGGSFFPLHDRELFRQMELGTNWFLYHKQHARGAISDPTADMFEGYVGWEMDYFMNWRLSSDLAWTVRWGAFFPGDAYSDKDMRNFLFTGVTWSF